MDKFELGPETIRAVRLVGWLIFVGLLLGGAGHHCF
jgi:hypothetical protein